MLQLIVMNLARISMKKHFLEKLKHWNSFFTHPFHTPNYWHVGQGQPLTQHHLDRGTTGGYTTEFADGGISGDENHPGVLPNNPRTQPRYQTNTLGPSLCAAATMAAWWGTTWWRDGGPAIRDPIQPR
jgi:hypothetical protein